MITFDGPPVEKKPVPKGDTPLEKIQRYKRVTIDLLKEIIPKLNLISSDARGGKLPLNKLLHCGGVVRSIKLVINNFFQIKLNKKKMKINEN